jgi:hypothetical protein
MDASPARLIVTRTSRDDVGTRQIILSLDGEPWATLLDGQSATRDIAPGPHRLRAYNTLVWKTVEFDVAPGESVRFSAVNRAGRGTAALIALLGVGPLYVTLERLHDPS